MKIATPPRFYLGNALGSFVGSRSSLMPTCPLIGGKKATKRLVSLKRMIRLERARLPEVSEQFANLNGKTLNFGLRGVVLKR